jgi:hypothetical protein
MLLETLDIKHNDLIIYSQNSYDLNNNFKLLYKDDPSLKPHPVTYSEVCVYLNEFTPKSVIIYRLLTNLTDFSVCNLRFGSNLMINGTNELVYPDPIFALKEMEQYISSSGNYDLRFRIQQIGLTTLTRVNKAANYAEIFSIDLTGVEALNQNDKVFVDALLAKGVFKEAKSEINNSEEVKARFTLEKTLSEDQSYIIEPKKKITEGEGTQASTGAGNKARSFSEFLRRKANKPDDPTGKEISSPILEIFYSNEKLENHIGGKEDTNVVLKLDPDQI